MCLCVPLFDVKWLSMRQMEADNNNKETMHAHSIYFFFIFIPFFQYFTLHSLLLVYLCANIHAVNLFDAVSKGLLNDEFISGSRVLVVNVTNGALISSVWWSKNIGGLSEPNRVDEEGIRIGFEPNKDYPWYEDEMTSPGLRSPKFIASPESISGFRGWWTYPYYSCKQQSWILSYSIAIPPLSKHG